MPKIERKVTGGGSES